MIKYASRFQMALYFQQGYNLVCFNREQDWWGIFLTAPTFRDSIGTKMAATGTKAELEALITEYCN